MMDCCFCWFETAGADVLRLVGRGSGSGFSKYEGLATSFPGIYGTLAHTKVGFLVFGFQYPYIIFLLYTKSVVGLCSSMS